MNVLFVLLQKFVLMNEYRSTYNRKSNARFKYYLQRFLIYTHSHIGKRNSFHFLKIVGIACLAESYYP